MRVSSQPGSMQMSSPSGFFPLNWLTASLIGEFRFFHAEGDVDQLWYRNEDLPAGTEINNIPYEIESLQGRIHISVGASF